MSGNPYKSEHFKRELPRVLNLFDASAIVVGAVIGSGIFLVPAIIAQEVQSLAGILLVWTAAGLISLFGSMTYAELGSSFPKAGGQYVFLRKAYNPLFGFLFGWTYLVVLAPGSFATLSVAFRDTMATLIEIPESWAKVIPVTVIIIILAVNYRATKLGAGVQNGFTLMKAGALLFIIGLVAFGNTGHTENFTPVLPEKLSINQFIHAVSISMIPAFWAYNGWHRVCFSAGEIKDAPKVIPRSLYIGMTILIILYIFSNLSYLSVLSVSGVASSSNVAGETVRSALGTKGHTFISIAVLISISGAMSTMVLTGPRVLFAMARDGLFFSSCGWVHPRFHTPAIAILIPASIGIVLSLFGNFRELLTFNVLFNWSFYGFTVIGVFLLRKKYPNIKRPFRIPGYPVIPLLFAAGVGWVVFTELASIGERTPMALLGFGLVMLGFPAYFFWKQKADKAAATLKE